jgi:hypothetical protein
MFSTLRKGLIYNNISSDIVEHDLDIDADQWSYDGKDVYRGSIDPEYLSKDLNVYWLYDDNLKRVGLAEHEAKEPEVFKSLWFHDNPFATLYQDPSWKSTHSTLWSKLSNEAYQDYLEGLNIHDEAIRSGILLVTPSMLMNAPNLYTCEKCGKKSLTQGNVCSNALVCSLDFSQFSILFLDDDFVIYERRPLESTTQPCDASEPEPSVGLSELAVQESLDALTEPPPQEQPLPSQ